MLWLITKVGSPILWMTFAIVKVFPEPVTPSNTENRCPARILDTNASMAAGWSPAGS